MIFEIVNKAMTTRFVEFGKNIVEENERAFGGFLTNKIGFGKFESKDNRA